MSPYKNFTAHLKLLINEHPKLITTTLSNIFTMRLIGNKTHGDLAEIAIAEFINQYMYNFRSIHVGKDLFRAKSHEEDITIINKITAEKFPVSLKAYGDGPLQLSTDKGCAMFQLLSRKKKQIIDDRNSIDEIFADSAFAAFNNINVLPLIYDEKKQRCNILTFDYERAKNSTSTIKLEDKGNGRKHPVYRFYDQDLCYICEVRYGNTTANALQRGLWTHTRNGLNYFESITNGWIDYSQNKILVQLFSHALVSSEAGHQFALAEIKKDLNKLKQAEGLPS